MNSSRLWEHFHQIEFVSCNECKTLLAFISINGINNLKYYLNYCSKIKTQLDDLNQTTVHDFYSSTKKSKKIKLSIA